MKYIEDLIEDFQEETGRVVCRATVRSYFNICYQAGVKNEAEKDSLKDPQG